MLAAFMSERSALTAPGLVGVAIAGVDVSPVLSVTQIRHLGPL
jgi:hypothetical protein